MSEKKEQSPFLKISRKFFNDPFWEEKRKFSKAEAWIDILQMVNFKDKEFLINNVLYSCGRGEACISMLNWAERWNWSRCKVQNFFKILVKMKRITYKTDSKTTHLKVCKYDSYNKQKATERHQNDIKQTSKRHQTGTTKEREECKERKNTTTCGGGNILFSKANIIKKSKDILNMFPIAGSPGMLAEKACLDAMNEWLEVNNQSELDDCVRFFERKMKELSDWCEIGKNRSRCPHQRKYFETKMFNYDLPDYSEFASFANNEVNQFELLKQL